MIKKHLIIVILVCIGLYSCKKEYSCQCSTTYGKTGYNSYTVSSVQQIDKKTTKKTAERICAQAEKQIRLNDVDYKTELETVSISCAVK